MKRTYQTGLILILSVMLFLSVFPLTAQAADDRAAADATAELMATSGKCGDNLTWSFNSSTGQLTISGSGDMYDWSDNDQPWADFKEQIKKVVVNSGATTVGFYAFRDCSALTGVTLPASLKTLEYGAFKKCTALKSVTIPSKVTSIGGEAFYGCSALTGVTIQGKVTSIGGSAFEACASLTGITLPSSVTSIGEYAFRNCSSLTEITIPSGVKKIEGALFSNCSSLETVFLSADSVTQIDGFAFEYCSSLTGITLPSSVESIGRNAFYGCTSLEEITIPDGVKSIEINTFCGCSSLNWVRLPDALETIGEYAFSGCASLTEVFIPAKVTSIGVGAFSGCSSLEEFRVDEENTAFTSIDGVLYGLGEERMLYPAYSDPNDFFSGFVIAQAKQLVQYPAAKEESSYNVALGVTVIGASAFENAEHLTLITLPDTVEKIGSSAFSGCKSLQRITIPHSVAELGNSALQNCSSLKCAAILGAINPLNAGVFSGCSALTDVSLPKTVTSIGLGAFSACKALENVYFDGSQSEWDSITVHRIGNSALNGVQVSCHMVHGLCGEDVNWNYDTDTGSLVISGSGVMDDFDPYGPLPPWYDLLSGIRSVTVAEGVTVVGAYAFTCSKAGWISIPASVTEIGCRALAFCPELSEIRLDSGNTAYQTVDQVLLSSDGSKLICYPPHKGQAFYAVPEGVTTIGDAAFAFCSSLRTVELPEGTERIEKEAFWECTALTGVTLPDSLEVLGEGAFKSCLSLKNIEIPYLVTEIGDYAFCYCYALKGVEIPDGVDRIGTCAFFSCFSLKTVSVPGSVTELGVYAFSACDELKDIFYGGAEENWTAMANEADAGSARLFTSEDYDEELMAEIQTEEFPGGVLIIADAPRGEVYYTVDGTLPCSASIPGEVATVLDTPGDYFINAVVIDPETGTCGDRITEYVGLEQSAVPEIYEENGEIRMRSEGGEIWYSFDLTNDPIESGDRYEQPIRLSESKTVRAQVLENGKVPSEIVSYAFFVTEGGISYPDDSYNFTNTAPSFGYSSIYRIGEGRYEEIFGTAAGSMLYEIYGSKWGGSCYGMSATSLMFSSGILSLDNYGDGVENVNGVPAPKSRESELTKLIERYQVSQFLPAMVMERNDISSGGNMVISGLSEEEAGDRLLGAIQSACSGGEPIILIVWRQGLAGSHAVVPYKLETGKVYLYDCNRPNEENVLEYAKENGTYRFKYGEYSYAVSYNTLSTLLEGLEGLQTGTVSLTADGREQMLVSLNTSSFEILDENGNRVEDYLTVRATEDMQQTEETMLYLERGRYTIVNTDASLDELRLSAATEDDYNAVIAAPGAEIGLGIAAEHLYLTVRSGEAQEIRIHTSNGSGQENDIELTADYVKVYASTDQATLLEASVSTVTRNGIPVDLTKKLDSGVLYEGAIQHPVDETGPGGYGRTDEIVLSTDIGGLLGEDFTLTANITGAGNRATVYAASYDDMGRMVSIRSRETEEGKTKYPFLIGADTAEVKLFVLDSLTGEPLTESLLLR